nr:YjaG family protein [Kistimonas asteriae]
MTVNTQAILLDSRANARQLSHRLKTLKPWQQAAFAIAMAERGWPNFALFADIAEFGEPDEVRHCLNMLWDFVAGHQSAKNFERLLERLDEQTPDVDQYDMYGVYPALDAIVAITTAVQCAMEPSLEEAASTGALTLATIGRFIRFREAEELSGTELAQYIEEHELFEAQQAFISDVIDCLEQAPAQKPELKKTLKALASNDNTSHLGISLDG